MNPLFALRFPALAKSGLVKFPTLQGGDDNARTHAVPGDAHHRDDQRGIPSEPASRAPVISKSTRSMLTRREREQRHLCRRCGAPAIEYEEGKWRVLCEKCIEANRVYQNLRNRAAREEGK